MEIGEKEKEVKNRIMEKVVENKVFNRRPPMFSCIRLRKRQKCCKAKDWWRNSSYHQTFIPIKQGSNSVQDNVWKNYYLILLPRTLVIFFWNGHGFILKCSILMNVPFILGIRDMKWSSNLWHQDEAVRINIGWRTK